MGLVAEAMWRRKVENQAKLSPDLLGLGLILAIETSLVSHRLDHSMEKLRLFHFGLLEKLWLIYYNANFVSHH